MRGGGAEEPAAVDLQRCRGLLDEASRDCYIQEFQRVVGDADDPRPAVAAIESAARSEGGSVLANCHGVMHTVGRTYAVDGGLTLADLQDVLPRSNDPGCSAGFAHGLVSGVAPSIDPRRPREAAAGLRERRNPVSPLQLRARARARVHAHLRRPSCRRRSALCRALGPRTAPDCAQGAYHDYWFAVAGADQAALPAGAATDPRTLCAAQPAEFVRPCWYRAFVDDRPEGIVVDSAIHLDVLCRDLAGLQREACITGAAVIGPADPEQQLALCARPRGATGCRRLHPRNEGAESARRGDGRVRAAARTLRALRRHDEDRLLPLARQDGRRAHGRRVRPRGLSVARARGRPPFLRGGRP